MPTVEVDTIGYPVTLNYLLERPSNTIDTPATPLIVLINGLADDLTTWSLQTPAFRKAGYWVLSFDNRGIGKSSRPSGNYYAEILAADLHNLLLHVATAHAHELPASVKSASGGLRFHLSGISMGGMIAQSYALIYPNGSAGAKGMELASLSLCCTYAEPTQFCLKMFENWVEKAKAMSVAAVMQDVMLWAFTVPFFRKRGEDVKEVEEAMSKLDMPTETYISQINVIQTFNVVAMLDGVAREMKGSGGKGLGGIDGNKLMVLAGEEDILIPTDLSRELADKIPGSRFVTVRGGHACCWEFSEDYNRALLEHLRASDA